jgi:hypothetical protein
MGRNKIKIERITNERTRLVRLPSTTTALLRLVHYWNEWLIILFSSCTL